MTVLKSYAAIGFEGTQIRVEVDIRRGIPGIDIVGMPDLAVRESRERVRVAIRNSGFRFPTDRVLINLAPADIRKEGSRFDLPIAVAILIAAGCIPSLEQPKSLDRIMLLGELDLSGSVQRVRGALAAVTSGATCGVTHFIVPVANLAEAAAVGCGKVCGVSSLQSAITELQEYGKNGEFRSVYHQNRRIEIDKRIVPRSSTSDCFYDFHEMHNARALKRAVTIAVAGRHHIMLSGPPGSGKTMAARRLPSILPLLDWKTSVEATKIHSIAGLLDENEGLIKSPPFRAPHHSATAEGLLGGGRRIAPGEISLAHGGILFLDETPEFKPSILQGLREPIETKEILITRAESRSWFPADFQLVLCFNLCPCGNLGRDDESCFCSRREIQVYNKRLGGPLLDRIDIRHRAKLSNASQFMATDERSSEQMLADILNARRMQHDRYIGSEIGFNGAMPMRMADSACHLSRDAVLLLRESSRNLTLSGRSHLSVLRTARTIADLAERSDINDADVEEAIDLRRYGDGDLYWR